MAAVTEHSMEGITIRPAGLPEDLSAPWVVGKMRRNWGIAAGISIVASVIGFIFIGMSSAEGMKVFMRAYLIGFMWCLGSCLGCMVLLMLQHVTGGKWGLVMRRPFEAASRTIWLVAIMFIPIALNVKTLYTWASGDLTFHGQHSTHVREVYLNIHAWVIRAIIFFASWGLFIFFLNKWSALQDQPLPSYEASERLRLRLMRLGAGGVLFYAITITLASIDWVMSLDAVWYSTIYGMIYMAGQALEGLALSIIVLVMLARFEPFRSMLRKTELHDNGKLLLAFVMLFTYLSFSQFIIIWSGNLTEEIPWYLARIRNGWRPITVVFALIHFAVPFLLLLNRNLKKQGPRLAKVAILLIVARYVDIYWQVLPNFADAAWPTGSFAKGFHWTDVVVPFAMFALWLTLYFWELGKRPIIPAYNPLVPQILEKSHGAH